MQVAETLGLRLVRVQVLWVRTLQRELSRGLEVRLHAAPDPDTSHHESQEHEKGRQEAMTHSRFGGLLLSCGVFLLLASAASAQDHAYTGAKKCKMCHLKQFKSWEKTQMANAFELLRPGVAAEAKTGAGLDPEKDYTLDAECVSCHVTGHGKEGGFVDAAIPFIKNAQKANKPFYVNLWPDDVHGPFWPPVDK